MIRSLLSPLAVATVILAGCRAGSLLDAPVPAGVVDPSTLNTLQGAEALRSGTIETFASAYTGNFELIQWSGVLSDEMHDGYPGVTTEGVDARTINPANAEPDAAYTRLQKARQEAAEAVRRLEPFGSQAAPGDVSEMWSLEGYTVVLLAEHWCAGVPLSDVSETGAITYGTSLTTDSLFAFAIALFDSARAKAAGSTSALALAEVGAARALVDRGRYAAAAAAAPDVPASFTYRVQLDPASYSVYQDMATAGGYLTVADHKGGNGLDFISAKDPRMPIDTNGKTYLGAPHYYALKFPLNTASGDPVPLASGTEASLIRAEVLLPINGGSGSAWLDTLQALRAAAGDAETIVDPGTPSGQLDVLMRERAFWMYGTAHRVGDLRRLIRQYGRAQNTVFPTGPFVNGTQTYYTTYGTDVNFPLLNAELGNPNFHGCLNNGA
jgi:starch-binding outer membrane protein, SusD/RagB family